MLEKTESTTPTLHLQHIIEFHTITLTDTDTFQLK